MQGVDPLGTHNVQPGSDGSATDTRRRDLRRCAAVAGGFVALLWLVWLVDAFFALHLYRFGVYPRDVGGLPGILLSPLVHGSFAHLFANTLPLFILGTALLYGYPRAARVALPLIYLGSGLGTWLFARSSFHIGASGLTHGMMFFVFIIGVLRRDRPSIALSLLVFFLYGGMVWGIFPQDPNVSYETHFFGAVMGVALAFLLRNRDPRPPERRYDWEDEAGDADEPSTGEPWQGSEDERSRDRWR